MNNFQTPINPVLNTNRLFPQPQGTVYIIDNEAELNNIPVSSSLSVAIDTTSKVLYIKSMQNGAPTMLTYKLSEVNPMPTIEQPVPGAKATAYSGAVTSVVNLKFSVIIKILPSCCAVVNSPQSYVIKNTGVGSSVTNAAITVVKL